MRLTPLRRRHGRLSNLVVGVCRDVLVLPFTDHEFDLPVQFVELGQHGVLAAIELLDQIRWLRCVHGEPRGVLEMVARCFFARQVKVTSEPAGTEFQLGWRPTYNRANRLMKALVATDVGPLSGLPVRLIGRNVQPAGTDFQAQEVDEIGTAGLDSTNRHPLRCRAALTGISRIGSPVTVRGAQPPSTSRRHFVVLDRTGGNVVKLIVRDRESIQEAVRRFRKLVERSGIKKEMRRREYYEKPSEVKRRSRLRAERRARRNRLLAGE